MNPNRRTPLPSRHRGNALFIACLSLWLQLAGSASGQVAIEILQQPANAVVLENTQASFSVVARGTLDQTNIVPLAYQWQRILFDEIQWVNLPDATNVTYTTPPTTACSQIPALYRCEIRAGQTTVLSQEARLTVIVDCLGPQIVAVSGDTAMNEVVVRYDTPMEPSSATDIFNYSLTEANTADYISIEAANMRDPRTVVLMLGPLTQLQPGGTYRLVVNNVSDLSDPACSCGVIRADTTANFTLPPRECIRITRQPRSRTVLEDCPVTFEVAARWVKDSFPHPLSYQWFKDGSPIAGATNSSHTTPPVSLADNGSAFNAVITSSCNSVTSSVVVLTITLDFGSTILIEARPGLVQDTVILSFSSGCGVPDGRLRPETTTDPFNYEFSGGLEVLTARLDCTGTNVLLWTTPQQPGSNYTVIALNLNDVSYHSINVVKTATFTVPVRVPVPAGVLRSTMEGNQMWLEWAAGGILQTAEQPAGPWIDLTAGPSPYLITPSPFPCANPSPLPQQFFRVRWNAP